MPTETRTPPEPGSTGPDLARSPRILAVDDEPVILDLMRLALEPLGYAVVTCSTAEDALEILEREDVAVVLTDFSLPGMDGIAFQREMESRGHSASKRTIILTGDATNEAVDGFAEKSGIGVLRKPFDLAALTLRVEEMIGREPGIAPARRPR